jgi:SPP1 gp7 family putative phage head morphogenesis protein
MASRQGDIQALILDREKSRLENMAIRAMRPYLRRARAAAIAALRDNRQIVPVMLQQLDPIVGLLADLMAAAHLSAAFRVYREGVKHGGRYQLSQLDDALAFLSARLELSSAELAVLRKTYSIEALDMVSNAARVVQEKVTGAMQRVVAEGLHNRAAQQVVQQALEASGFTSANPYMAETLVRTQTGIAYSAGQFTANTDPDIDEILWGYEYVTVGDDRVRPNHQALEGFRAPKDDPRWNTIRPPNGYNCRCTLIEVWKDDPELASATGDPDAVELDGEVYQPVPDAGWDFDPGQLYQQIRSLV